MSVRRALTLSGCVLAAFLAIFLTTTLVRGAPGTAADGNDSSGIDIKTLGHTDVDIDENGTQDIVLMVDTYETFNPESDFFLMQWDFDLNGSPASTEACVLLQQDGSGGLRATLFGNGCDTGSGNLGTSDAVLTPCPGPTHLEFSFQRSEFKTAGLQDSTLAYGYKVSSTDLNGGSDTAPDTGRTTHTFGASPNYTPPSCPVATPTPTTTATPAPTTTPAATPTPTGTPAPTSTPTPTTTPAPTATPTPAPTATPTPSPSPTPAAGGSASDGDDVPAGGVDVKKISHADGDFNGDDQEDIKWTLETYENFDPETDFFKAQWDYDFNGDGIASEACLSVEQDGAGGLRGSLFPGCGSENVGTQDAVVTSTTVVITFPKSSVVDAGLQASATGYSYRVTNNDFSGNQDVTPDSTLTAHTFGQAQASPTPTPASSATPTPSASGSPTPAPEEITEGTADAGGTVTSDEEGDGATADDPVETEVTVPAGGDVTITEGDITDGDPTGFELFGQQVDIDAPDGTITDPLTIVFLIDASVLGDAEVDEIALFRDGDEVADCDGEDFTDVEDVCLESSELNDDGDAELTVSTVHASVWTFALPQVGASPTPAPTTTTDTTSAGSGSGSGSGSGASSGAGSGSGSLPNTGASFMALLAVAAVLVYGGTELSAWARRRRLFG